MCDIYSSSEHRHWKQSQHREMIDDALMQLFKFWEDGRPAILNINTHGGQAWINFSGSLGFHSDQTRKSTMFQTNSFKNKNSQSPSKIKRNQARAKAFREKKARDANNSSEKSVSSSQFQSKSSSNILADVSEIKLVDKVHKGETSSHEMKVDNQISDSQILDKNNLQEPSTQIEQIETSSSQFQNKSSSNILMFRKLN